jgi:hypothetical protein
MMFNDVSNPENQVVALTFTLHRKKLNALPSFHHFGVQKASYSKVKTAPQQEEESRARTGWKVRARKVPYNIHDVDTAVISE